MGSRHEEDWTRAIKLNVSVRRWKWCEEQTSSQTGQQLDEWNIISNSANQSITVLSSPKYENGRRAGKSPECPNLVEVKLLHIIGHIGRKERSKGEEEENRRLASVI